MTAIHVLAPMESLNVPTENANKLNEKSHVCKSSIVFKDMFEQPVYHR